MGLITMFNKQFPALQYFNLDGQIGNTIYFYTYFFQHPTLVELRLNTGLDKRINYEHMKMFNKTVQENSFLSDPDRSTMLEIHRMRTENTALEHLYVDGSDLEIVSEEQFVDYFGHLRALRTLSLAHSQLDFISAGMFASFANLSTLILREKAISIIPDGVFDGLTQLRYLDLSGNKLTVVSPQTFGVELRHQITILGLVHNPFVCSCDLLWFRQ
jgi:Leucine-rich repeat (LRR) protein